MEYLTFALAKGRLADITMDLLEKMGITCDEMKENSRKLIFTNEELKLKFFLAKASDVPTYVEYVKEKLESSNDLRVATKYPNIAKEYFYQKKHQTIEIVKLHGSVELAPIVGLADVIVDIVETGSTLKANGLEVLADVCPISARMVVNRVSMKLEHERIANIINGLRKMVGENK